METFEVSWKAPEYEYHEKSLGWYWGSIAVAVFFVAIAVWQRNFLLGVFVVLAEVMVMVWGNQQPRMIDFKLTERELTVAGAKSYAYAEIENFSVSQEGSGEWVEVFFDFRKRLRSRLRITVHQEDLEEIRGILASVLKEVEHEESLVDRLEKLAGF